MLVRPFVASLLLALTMPVLAQAPRRFPASSEHRGLPTSPLAFAPYHADADHVHNRVFRSLWLANQAPTEVAAVIDSADAMQWTAGWVHKKRPGLATDSQWFGGDGRLLPLEGLAAAAATDMLTQLATLRPGTPAVDDLLATPELAVLFQHDLLRVAERLLDTKQNPELVPALHRAAMAVALPARTLASLRDPLRRLLASDVGQRDLAAQVPTTLGGTASELHEVLRKSTRLFDAEKSLLWSRVFLAHPEGKTALARLLPAALQGDETKKGPLVPIGLRALLVQGIVAFDHDGIAHATPLVFDVRTQVLVNREPLAATNATFTHDGIDFGIWQLEREGVRRGEAAQFFRRIEADDQDLFRDYGTGKHTTYRGQCSLCHRNTDTPEPHLGGFPVLRPHAQATFATTGDERLRLAETQAQKLMQRVLAAR